MDGIILINKESNMTSRDVVNIVSKRLGIKKVGHAGTLDPIAVGLMIIGVGKGTKILDLLTLDKKEYIATVKIGFQTDTLDITGQKVLENNNYNITISKLKKTLDKFTTSYMQVVPKYSAVKINGKKLYEYARNNVDIKLPSKLVTIYNIELLEFDENNQEFKFKTIVSKGTYIRSLINDIGNDLGIPMTMKELIRTKSGKFNLESSNQLNDNYNILKIYDCLDYKIMQIKDELLLKKIKNGNLISLNIDDSFVSLIDKNNNLLAIYQKKKKNEFKAFKVF